jgi:hypothetical protein
MMKTLLLAFIALGSASAFSAEDYCTSMDAAKTAGYKEIARLTQIAAEQTDMLEINKIIKQTEAVEAVNFKINEVCPKN